MTIGEKIKKLRNAKFMTQSELAGNEITRNMLSYIENGSAQPSLKTVKYIAERLNVTQGFLLGDEKDEALYFKSTEMDNIKKAYADKNFRLCREMCKNSEWQDDELYLIHSECSMQAGIEEFNRGNLRNCIEYFDEALGCCEKTVYNTDIFNAYMRAYFSYMRIISPTLTSDIADDSEKDKLIIIGDIFCAYSKSFCDFENGNTSCGTDLPQDSSYRMHLAAKLMMSDGDYKGACGLLHRILYENSFELPEPMLYFVFCDMEICCKETEDFKGAYEYSASKLSLLQKLLS